MLANSHQGLGVQHLRPEAVLNSAPGPPDVLEGPDLDTVPHLFGLGLYRAFVRVTTLRMR